MSEDNSHTSSWMLHLVGDVRSLTNLVNRLQDTIAAIDRRSEESSQHIAQLTEMITPIFEAHAAQEQKARQKRRRLALDETSSSDKCTPRDMVHAFLFDYIPNYLEKSCYELMLHIANTVLYQIKFKEELYELSFDSSGKKLYFALILTWAEQPEDSQEAFIACLKPLYQELPFTLSDSRLLAFSACFANISLTNRRTQENRVLSRMIWLYRDSECSAWPPNSPAPANCKLVSETESGNIILSRNPVKSDHKAYASLNGPVSDNVTDTIVNYAKAKLISRMAKFKAEYEALPQQTMESNDANNLTSEDSDSSSNHSDNSST